MYVLSESYSDPKRIPNLKINKNPLANIDNFSNKNTSGYMLSAGYGGRTANMEYMADISLLTNFFSPALSVPYT